LAVGKEVLLVTDLPMADGRARSARLRLTVSSCRAHPESTHEWRIGGALLPMADEDRATLVAYCHVAAARSRLTESGKISARIERSALPAPRVDHSDGAGGRGRAANVGT